MKKFATLTFTLLLGVGSINAQIDATAAKAALDQSAQGDSTGNWTTSGVVQLNMNQVSLTNWAAGGFSSIAGIAMFNGLANRKWGRNSWDNNLVLAYGLLNQEGSDVFKTDDRIELNSRYGYDLKPGGPWAIAAMLQFKTQFTEGFDASSPDARISDLMSPGYLLIGAGLTYKPNEDLSIFISPAMTKMTFVTDQVLADAGAFGVDAATYDDMGQLLTAGENSRFELGGFIALQYTKQLAENISFLTRADLFSNYLDRPQNMDVSWETMTTFKINDWFAASLNTLLLYDHDIDIARSDLELDAAGLPVDGQILSGPTVQFKQALGIGLTFNLK